MVFSFFDFNQFKEQSMRISQTYENLITNYCSEFLSLFIKKSQLKLAQIFIDILELIRSDFVKQLCVNTGRLKLV